VWDAVTGTSVAKLAYLHRKGVSILAFSQGPKQTWKAALPSSVALVEQEGAGSGKGPGLGSAVGDEKAGKKKPGPTSAGPAVEEEVLIGPKAGLVGAGYADACKATDGAGWDENGYRLVSVGLDSDHTVAVWHSRDGNWADAKLAGYAPSSKEKVLFACFIGSTENRPCDLVTGGIKHVTFWQLSGRTLVPYAGVFGRKGRIQPIVSGVVHDNKLFTGAATGHLYMWVDRTVARSVQAHEKTINSMHSTGDFLVTGCKDGSIKIWGNGADLTLISQFDISTSSPRPVNLSIRSVRLLLDRHRSCILVGTKSSDLYEVNRLNGRMVQLSTAHFGDEVWGLAPHPTNPDLYISCGDDKTIRLWSVSRKRQLAIVMLENHMRAIAWSPDGTMLAVGYGGRTGTGRSRKDGSFVLLKAADLSTIHEGQDSRDWICEIKFSPDSSLLAMSSQDSKVYIYALAFRKDTGAFDIKLSCKCEMSNAAVRQLDFDRSSKFLQTCDLQGEYIMYTAGDGERITHPSELKDLEWSSFNCVFGYPLLGAWSDGGAEVTTAARNSKETLLVTGENTGRLKLFRYPAAQRKQVHRVFYAHSGPLTKARFTADDAYIVTSGGPDQTIIQWRLDVPMV